MFSIVLSNHRLNMIIADLPFFSIWEPSSVLPFTSPSHMSALMPYYL